MAGAPRPVAHLFAKPHPDYGQHKTIHFVRHGEGTHNVTTNYHLESEFDANLTAKGRQQAAAAGVYLALHHLDLVIVSPLSRALQTAEGALQVYSEHTSHQPPVLIHEACRESMQFGEEPCNRRRTKSEIQALFPFVQDFVHHAHEAEHDAMWTGSESSEQLEERARSVLNFIAQRRESNICVVTHSVFLDAMFSRAAQIVDPKISRSYFSTGEVRSVVLVPKYS
jgi:broad specificity phosphatase PhoE